MVWVLKIRELHSYTSPKNSKAPTEQRTHPSPPKHQNTSMLHYCSCFYSISKNLKVYVSYVDIDPCKVYYYQTKEIRNDIKNNFFEIFES